MRILVAEEDTGTGRLLSSILQRCGHHVEWKWDAAKALKSMLERPPDLAIVDLQLSGMDGLEVLSRLRSDPGTRGVPAMAISAGFVKEQVDRCRALGVLDFIVKPFNPALVRHRVQRAARMLS